MLSEQLNSIEIKIKKLIEQLATCQEANIALKKENQYIRTELKNKVDKISALDYKLSKTTQALEKKREDDPKSSKDLRKEIDIYISEIDKCIEWLQSH